MADTAPPAAPAAPPKHEPRWIKALTEYVPTMLFLGAYYLFGLTFAIQVIVVVTAISLVATWFIARRLPIIPLVAASGVLLFGGISWLVGDDTIYKMKPTVMMTLMSIGLLAGVGLGRYFLKDIVGDTWVMVDEGWKRLTFEYCGVLVFLAIANEIVWRSFSDNVWVTFKIFGFAGVFITYTLARQPYIKRMAPKV